METGKTRAGERTIGDFSRNLKLIRSKGPSLLGDTVGALAIDQIGDLARRGFHWRCLVEIAGRIGDSPSLALDCTPTTGWEQPRLQVSEK